MRLDYIIKLNLEGIDTVCTAYFSADTYYQECDNYYELEMSNVTLNAVMVDEQNGPLKMGEIQKHALNEVIYQTQNNTDQFYEETKAMIRNI